MPFFGWYVLLSVLWTFLGLVLMSAAGAVVNSCITTYWKGRSTCEVAQDRAQADREKIPW